MKHLIFAFLLLGLAACGSSSNSDAPDQRKYKNIGDLNAVPNHKTAISEQQIDAIGAEMKGYSAVDDFMSDAISGTQTSDTRCNVTNENSGDASNSVTKTNITGENCPISYSETARMSSSFNSDDAKYTFSSLTEGLLKVENSSEFPSSNVATVKSRNAVDGEVALDLSQPGDEPSVMEGKVRAISNSEIIFLNGQRAILDVGMVHEGDGETGVMTLKFSITSPIANITFIMSLNFDNEGTTFIAAEINGQKLTEEEVNKLGEKFGDLKFSTRDGASFGDSRTSPVEIPEASK